MSGGDKLSENASKTGFLNRIRGIVTSDEGSSGEQMDAAREGGFDHRLPADELLLELLRDLSEQLSVVPTKRQMDAAEEWPSSQAYVTRFGSWEQAIEAAGIESTDQRTSSRQRRGKREYSMTELRGYLKALADDIEEVPTTKDMDAASEYPSSTTYTKRFGSWDGALEAAGLEHSTTTRYTDEELLTHIRELGDEFNRAPTAVEMQKIDGRPAKSTYINRFSSWEAALDAAFDSGWAYGDGESSEAILRHHLQKLAGDVDGVPIGPEMDAAIGRPDAEAYEDCFGSWASALDAAGIERDKPRDRLIKHLQLRAEEVGGAPTVQQIDSADSRPSSIDYYDCFGGWSEALAAADLEPTGREQADRYSQKELLDHIRELTVEQGRPPTAAEMDNAENRPLKSTYFLRFQSWDKALEAAGVESPD